MSVLKLVKGVRGVRAAVVSDTMGVLLEAQGDDAAEESAAVVGYAVSSLREAGESLGLGDFERFSYQGEATNFIVVAHDDSLLTAIAASGSPLAKLDQQLQAALSSE